MTTRSPDLTLLRTPTLLPPLDELREWAQGTRYHPDDDGDPFDLREAIPHFEPLKYVVEEDRAASRLENAAGLRQFAIDVLSEPHALDPDVAYVHRVFDQMISALHERGSINGEELDLLDRAFADAVELSSAAVARAWLRERKSLPIAIE
jgi:hypothetical protein